MSDFTNDIEPADDVEGHVHRRADGEAAETDDTEGHVHVKADAETDETDDDVEGHVHKL